MRERDDQDPLLETSVVPGAGVGGQVVAPDEKSLFGPDPVPAPDSQGVNSEDVSTEDAELLSPGASPEFDHSLRRRNQAAADQSDT